MATNQNKITVQDTWTEVASGACFAQKDKEATVRVFFAAETPAEDVEASHTWKGGDFNYGGGDKVYMKCSPDVKVTVTEI